MVNEILNPIESTKGSIAEVKSGEGKEMIMLLVSVVLAGCYGKIIDIVMKDIQTAVIQHDEYEKYYQFFGIQKDILVNSKTDSEILKQLELRNDIPSSINDKFNVDAFDKQILFSTIENYETIYLRSLMTTSENRRNENRKYDVVLVDEIDNMLMNHEKGISFVSRDHDLLHSSEIYELVYIIRKQSVEDIKLIVEYYFKDGIALTTEIVKQLKQAALDSDNYYLDEDYIIQKKHVPQIVRDDNTGMKHYEIHEQETIVMIDKTTGKIKPNGKYPNFLHEMIEIKEKVNSSMNQNFISIIPHINFFNLYNAIAGITNAIGDSNDEKMLQEEYQVNYFRVPRYIESQTIVYERQRPKIDDAIFDMINEEIEIEHQIKRRPIIVVLDNSKRIDMLSKQHYYCQIITKYDKTTEEMITKMGKNDTITFITVSVFQSLSFSFTDEIIQNGGVHVIIPYWLKSQRLYEKVVGNVSSSGQPVTISIYTTREDEFEKNVYYHKTFKHMITIQNEFSEFIKEKYPFIFEDRSSISIAEQYPFGMTWDTTLQMLREIVSKRECIFNNEKQYHTYVYEMIMISWSVFFTNIFHNLEEFNNEERVKKEYLIFTKHLEDEIPPNDGKNVIKTLLKKATSETVVHLLGVTVIGGIINVFLPGIPGAIIKTSIGLIIRNGYEIARQRKSGKKINYMRLFLVSAKELIDQALRIFDVAGIIAGKVIGGFAGVFKQL